MTIYGSGWVYGWFLKDKTTILLRPVLHNQSCCCTTIFFFLVTTLKVLLLHHQKTNHTSIFKSCAQVSPILAPTTTHHACTDLCQTKVVHVCGLLAITCTCGRLPRPSLMSAPEKATNKVYCSARSWDEGRGHEGEGVCGPSIRRPSLNFVYIIYIQ